jgi:hypothetical protein
MGEVSETTNITDHGAHARLALYHSKKVLQEQHGELAMCSAPVTRNRRKADAQSTRFTGGGVQVPLRISARGE